MADHRRMGMRGGDCRKAARKGATRGSESVNAEDMLPRPVSRPDLTSNESRLACPVHLPLKWSPRKELHPDDGVRSAACCLLHHAERVLERRPGLAPGKNWFASSRLDGFGMRRMKSGTPGRICTGINSV